MPIACQPYDTVRERLRRLLMNPALDPARLYQPVAGFLLSCFTGGRVRLILDATDLGGRLPVLFVAVASRGRALPLAWRMLPAMGCREFTEQCREFTEQKALLCGVAALVPPSATVTLLADRAILTGTPVDHSLSDRVAALTETPYEKEIDAANGLRGHGGRTPTAEDFDGLLTPAGDSGDTVGSDVSERTLVFGSDGTL